MILSRLSPFLPIPSYSTLFSHPSFSRPRPCEWNSRVWDSATTQGTAVTWIPFLFFFFFFKCTCVASGRTFSTSGLFVEHTPTRLIPVPNHLLVGGHKTNPLVPVTIEWARLILSPHPSEVFNFPDHTFFFFFSPECPEGRNRKAFTELQKLSTGPD